MAPRPSEICEDCDAERRNPPKIEPAACNGGGKKTSVVQYKLIVSTKKIHVHKISKNIKNGEEHSVIKPIHYGPALTENYVASKEAAIIIADRALTSEL